MAHDIRFSHAQIEDADLLAPRLRAMDRVEIQALSAAPPLRLITESIQYSTRFCQTAWVDGEIACIFGIGAVTPLSNAGAPWLLGTDWIDRLPAAFIRRCTHYRERIQRLGYRRLENQVLADNRLAVRWLKWMGFVLDAPQPLGRHGELFHRFHWEA